jgi:hypothetical protein
VWFEEQRGSTKEQGYKGRRDREEERKIQKREERDREEGRKNLR